MKIFKRDVQHVLRAKIIYDQHIVAKNKKIGHYNLPKKIAEFIFINQANGRWRIFEILDISSL